MSRNNMKSIMRTAGKATVFAVLFSVPYPVRAFVLWKLWKWFIVPLGLCQQISFIHSLALVITSALLLINVHKNQGEHMRPPPGEVSSAMEDTLLVTLETVLRGAFILVVGYILHLMGPK